MKPTYIFAHGWEGDPSVWDETAKRLATAYGNSPDQTVVGANILAYDWSVQANPNAPIYDLDAVGEAATNILLPAIVRAGLVAWQVVDGWNDAFIANENARSMAHALSRELQQYDKLGSQLHFIGKSLGGGLLAVASKELKELQPTGIQTASLTMVDSPDAYGVDAMQYLDPTAAERTLVFYYDEFLRCGFGEPAAYPAINLKMDPDRNAGGVCVHMTITKPGAWFPELIRNGLILEDRVLLYPREIAQVMPSTWWAETDYVHHFDPLGACCTFGLFGYEGCQDLRLERDCVSAPLAPRVWAGPHTRCSADGGCPTPVVDSTLEGTGEVESVPESRHPDL
jgi:pimeloyl-ACP methyl ester carboxylesterase